MTTFGDENTTDNRGISKSRSGQNLPSDNQPFGIVDQKAFSLNNSKM